MIQNSPEWFAARKCKITASRFGDVLAAPTTKRYLKYQQELIDNIKGVPDFGEDSKPWFKHGAEMEAEARKQYEWYMLSKGKDVSVQEIAMIVHPKYDFISCSPDGIIFPKKGIEIKSRISHKSHLESVKSGLPSNYKPQVLGSLWISGYDEWDFISFFKDPDDLIEMDINVTTVIPDIEYFSKLEAACLRFWREIQAKVNGIDIKIPLPNPIIDKDESDIFIKGDDCTKSKELIIAEKLVPADIFKTGGMDPVLSEIERRAKAHIPDLTTVKGRNAVKSVAAKVASSKTLLDNMGKELKAKYKVMIDPIDGERKKTRDFLDALKIEVRKPVTEWEDAEEKRKADEALAKEQAEWDAAVIVDYDNCFDAAIAENNLFNRERDMRLKEEEMQRQEDERKAKEEADRLEKERIEREEQLKKEAAEEARLKAEADAKAEKDLAEYLSDFDEAIAINQTINAEIARKKAESDKIAAEEKAAREKKEAEERERLAEARRIQEAKDAEQKRLDDIKAAEEKAAREKQHALDEQRAKQVAKEKAIQDEADKKAREDAARQANLEHRAKIHGDIKASIMAFGVDAEKAIEIVKALSKGEIKNVSVQY